MQRFMNAFQYITDLWTNPFQLQGAINIWGILVGIKELVVL
jgi:hypothetical protein